ncbi:MULTISPECIES: tyrosine-type recombinase/integrase [unclassified Clostridium]|uniref:tyrosine-type recombinase/integrase n=1 Tax=unclassified Clostridium TaxID=2614128 RepID=UPI0025BE3A6F|nr:MULTISPECIES: tyrosine-type recombinase/integrase [unclassified Clostridium]
MAKRKKVQYTTPELIEKINPMNKDLWKKYLNGKRTLSESTRYNYTTDMNQFFVFILKNHDNQYILDIDTDDMADILEDFLATCQSIFENKDRRMARRLSTISSMYIYYKKKRKIKENPVELLERPKIQKGKYEIKRIFLTPEQVEEIRIGLKELNNIQLTLMFELGLHSMARVTALNSIRLNQINFKNRRIEGVIEKEGYEVDLMLNDRCIELIKHWTDERKEQGIENEYLFITKYGGVYDKVDVGTMKSSWIKKIGKIINEPELSMHDLRHSGSDIKYKNGMSLESVSKALNHRSTQVTKDFYLTEDNDKLQEEMDKYSI